MKYIAIAIIIVFILGGITFAFLGNRSIQQEQTSAPAAQSQTQQQEPQTVPILSPNPTENKMIVEDIKTGAGVEAKTGNTVSVQYTGTLLNGKKFKICFLLL